MSARAVISTYNHDENKHGAKVEIRVQAFIPVLNIAVIRDTLCGNTVNFVERF